MSEQDKIRKWVKLAKAINDDLYYKDFAEYIGITEHGFYNFMNGYYDLGKEKMNKLYDVLIDLVDDEIC